MDFGHCSANHGELVAEAPGILDGGPPALGERPTLPAGDEVRDLLFAEKPVLENRDGQRLDVLASEVVVGAGGLALLAAQTQTGATLRLRTGCVTSGRCAHA